MRVAFQRLAIKVAPLTRQLLTFQIRRLPLRPIGGQLEPLLPINLSPLLLTVFTRFAFQLLFFGAWTLAFLLGVFSPLLLLEFALDPLLLLTI